MRSYIIFIVNKALIRQGHFR